MVDSIPLSNITNASHNAALRIAQEAVRCLSWWAGDASPVDDVPPTSDAITHAVGRAKSILKFDAQPSNIGTLRLLFDDVALPEGGGKTKDHWHPLGAIANENPRIPYPLDNEPDARAIASYKDEVSQAIAPVISNPQHWDNLSLLSLLLEKYGSCLSYGEPNVAFVDIVKITGALAAALAQNAEATHLSLVAGDLSGIQKFIYTISSAGALKSLRARSFYLELVTEEVVQQLLTELKLPRTNVIYAGGGNIYLLTPAQESHRIIQDIQINLNRWLRTEFQGKVFLGLAVQDCPVESVVGADFQTTWNEAIGAVNKQKTAKFRDQLEEVLELQDSHEPCRVCHRDDTDKLAPLNRLEPDSPLACDMCRAMFELGGSLFRVESMVRSHQAEIKGARPEYILKFQIGIAPIYYHLFRGRRPLIDESEQVLLVNNWDEADYAFPKFDGKVAPLLLGKYFQSGAEGFMTGEEFAEVAKTSGCIPRVGYLRMDVDRLGQIFANGLVETNNYSLPKLAGLSRQMSYFFKTYLNSLADKRQDNLPPRAIQLNDGDRRNLLFIYAGGDDLFVSGAWNEVTDFAFDVYQAFRAYTGFNRDITLSGGISLSVPKFPLYQAAEESGDAEGAAKQNGRDSLGLFGETFKWSAWLGQADKPMLSNDDQQYLQDVDRPELQGVFPFVDQLINQLEIGYAQSFLRNLLITAQLREKKIKDAEENQKQAIAYFLHLPKLAYTLSRLPKRIRDHPDFQPIRQSLMSPLNSPYFRAIAIWIELLTRYE